MDEVRPVWDFDMSENDARWFYRHAVDKITTSYTMTSADTADTFVHFYAGKNVLTRPSHYLEAHADVLDVSPDGHRVIQFWAVNYRAERMIKRLEEIDKWEKKNARDRSEFERLKKKFG